VGALWGARAAASILVSVLNIAYREREQRRFLHYHVTILWLTLWLCLFGLVALALITIVPLAAATIQLTPTTAFVLKFGRWPALAALMALGLASYEETFGALGAIMLLMRQSA
jgi:membrane protein